MEYDKDEFDEVVYRTKEPKSTTFFLNKGKVVANITSPEYIDAVAAADLRQRINLESVGLALGLENVKYNPERFAEMSFRIPELNATLIIFSSGKMNIVGTKQAGDAKIAFGQLKEMLDI